MSQINTGSASENRIATATKLLRQIFGDRLETGKSVREQHAHTMTYLENQPPDIVVFPQNVTEVAETVRVCADLRMPVVPFGAGTSLEGQLNAPGGGVSIDMSGMNQIISVNTRDMDCVVQPGVTRKQLNTYLRDTGLFFPVDPGADATIGGMAATRASGTNAVRYGTMKDAVIALEAVMPDGRIVRTASRARKTSAGYDLTRLLVGAEGTLGVITEITLRLHGIPEAISSATCGFADIRSACDAVIMTIQSGIPIARIELMDAVQVRAVNEYSMLNLHETPMLLLEFHGSPASVAEHAEAFGAIAEQYSGENFTWTSDASERNRLWQARHDAYHANLAMRPGTNALVTDVCVPISRLAECVTAAREKADKLNFPAPIVGHVGDGNFHFTLLTDLQNPKEIIEAKQFIGWLNDLAISMDGTCTGEHGIGQGKIRYLRRELGDAVDFMQLIKSAVDPHNIMNPEKIFRS